MTARAYLYLVITTLMWGGNSVVGKLAVGHVSPMMLNFGRWALALALITAISVPQLKRDWPLIRSHWLLLLAYGAVGYTLFNAFLYSALQFTSAVNGSIEQGGIPVLIFIINFLLFRIPVSLIQILGFMMSFVGVALTASHGDLRTLANLGLNIGDGLMMFAVLAYSIYTVALRWRPQIHWKSMMASAGLGAVIAATPLLFWEIGQEAIIWPHNMLGIGIILFAALLPSLVSQILYIKGVEVIGANRAGLFVNLVPIFGTLLSIALLGETLHMFHVIALALVLGGIALAEWGKPLPDRK